MPEAGAWRDAALYGCVYITEVRLNIDRDGRAPKKDQDSCIFGLFIKHRGKINASRKQKQREQQLPPIYTDSNHRSDDR